MFHVDVHFRLECFLIFFNYIQVLRTAIFSAFGWVPAGPCFFSWKFMAHLGKGRMMKSESGLNVKFKPYRYSTQFGHRCGCMLNHHNVSMLKHRNILLTCWNITICGISTKIRIPSFPTSNDDKIRWSRRDKFDLWMFPRIQEVHKRTNGPLCILKLPCICLDFWGHCFVEDFSMFFRGSLNFEFKQSAEFQCLFLIQTNRKFCEKKQVYPPWN